MWGKACACSSHPVLLTQTTLFCSLCPALLSPVSNYSSQWSKQPHCVGKPLHDSANACAHAKSPSSHCMAPPTPAHMQNAQAATAWLCQRLRTCKTPKQPPHGSANAYAHAKRPVGKPLHGSANAYAHAKRPSSRSMALPTPTHMQNAHAATAWLCQRLRTCKTPKQTLHGSANAYAHAKRPKQPLHGSANAYAHAKRHRIRQAGKKKNQKN